MCDSAPKFLALDEEANDQIVHRGRCREAHGATDEAREACPQSDMFTRDCLRMLLPNMMLLGGNMPLVGPQPSVEKRVMPSGSHRALRGTKTASCRRPKTYANRGPRW
jgi:hypothetical protein